MPVLKRLSLTIVRRHAMVTFLESMPRMLPALQQLCVTGEGWGGLVVQVPDTVAKLDLRMVRAWIRLEGVRGHCVDSPQAPGAVWRVYSTPGGMHHATYRQTAQGCWTVHVQCSLGEAKPCLEERVRGAGEFLMRVGTELGGLFS